MSAGCRICGSSCTAFCLFPYLNASNQTLLTRLSQERRLLEIDSKKAFRYGNKQNAVQLLPQIRQPADIRTVYNVPGMRHASMVSLLHLAAYHGWMDIVTDLITEYKCDTNCKDTHGRTPLHYATMNNHLEVVRYFIKERHCDPMTKDRHGNTPLHLACDYSHTHLVQCLLSTGKVDPLAKNKYGEVVYYHVCL